MVTKSWLVTLTPLFIAIATTLKSLLTGKDLSSNELELIKYLIGTFIASGAIGAYLSGKSK